MLGPLTCVSVKAMHRLVASARDGRAAQRSKSSLIVGGHQHQPCRFSLSAWDGASPFFDAVHGSSRRISRRRLRVRRRNRSHARLDADSVSGIVGKGCSTMSDRLRSLCGSASSGTRIHLRGARGLRVARSPVVELVAVASARGRASRERVGVLDPGGGTAPDARPALSATDEGRGDQRRRHADERPRRARRSGRSNNRKYLLLEKPGACNS